MKVDSKSYSYKFDSLFLNEEEVLICLYPFQKQVFANHFDWEANLKITYPLLSTISWKEMSKEIGFNSLNKLAKGILELQEPFKTELKEFSEWKKVDFPDYAADRIPPTILVPLIEYFQDIGMVEIRILKMDRFPDSETRLVSFKNKNRFEIYNELKDSKALLAENNVKILIPDFDCPYAILSGSKETCADIVKNCGIEFLKAKNRTQIDWWNQGEE
ncbi:hypothetical protein MM239_06140 [Belliella sp. DSM 111904]|uniref:DUF2711 family protein n=1 Tax=Belliella filtrata TaxID=2923435 RepID=A0ABS9UXR0_9BACT|nr:hypothetical protein [Belliella filtrata]MCH7408965.1 hypothetical protein [Belliella filtrata]